jgi:alpha-aminoadipic semialdehyde synthase
VIADITCDIDGSIEATVKATDPGEPVFVYDPFTGAATGGLEGRGVVVLAVDNLPCELPAEATRHFGDQLLRFLPAVARCDWDQPYSALDLPGELRGAVIVHRGELAPGYVALREPLDRYGRGTVA